MHDGMIRPLMRRPEISFNHLTIACQMLCYWFLAIFERHVERLAPHFRLLGFKHVLMSQVVLISSAPHGPSILSGLKIAGVVNLENN